MLGTVMLGCVTTPLGHPQTHTPTRRALRGCHSVPPCALGLLEIVGYMPPAPRNPWCCRAQPICHPHPQGLLDLGHIPDLQRDLLPPTLPHPEEPLGATPLLAQMSHTCTQTQGSLPCPGFSIGHFEIQKLETASIPKRC